jgi:outer membrane usher protein
MKSACISIACALFATVARAADDDAPKRVTFDATLLRGARDGVVDLSPFERGAAIAPGEHEVDVVRNGEALGRRRVRLDAAQDATPTTCVDGAFAAWLGVAVARLPAAVREALHAGECIAFDVLHAAADARYDGADLTVRVSIPQALLVRRDDAIDPAAFDAGIPAVRINHAANVTFEPGHVRHASLHLDAGANAGAWRWRHRGSHTWSASGRRSQALAATVERDVARFDARLTFGDFFVDGMGFDAVALRGVQFRSDDRMAPSSATHHAPIVRGTADTHARVQVRQAGALLLDVPVPPGPFALDTVRPLARGGALDVRVVEADGRIRSFALPYSAIPGLLRAGRARFDVAAGLWRGNGFTGDAPVFQGAMQRGLHDRLTLRGGAQLAPDYAQALAGTAFATPVGAFSLERLVARSVVDDTRRTGAGTRMGFTTQFAPTRTHVDVSAWHRPDARHRSLHEVMHARRSEPAQRLPIEGERFELSLHQSLGARRHALRMTVVARRAAPRADARSLQLAYALPVRSNGAQLQGLLEHGRETAPDAGRTASTMATLSLAIPLHAPSPQAPTFFQAHARAGAGHRTLQAGVGGAFGEEARNAWRAGLSRADAAPFIASASLARASRTGRIAAGWSAGAGRQQGSASFDGSLVLHAHGVTAGPSLGDTAALVRSEHGAGAKLLHVPQGRLDRGGRALVPHLSPYRRNRVGIDPLGAAEGVVFDWTERDVVPRAGALVDVWVPGTRSAARFVRILDAGGAPAVFGARIVDAAGTLRGQVGRDGITLLDAHDDATLTLLWRDGEDTSRCTLASAIDLRARHPRTPAHAHHPGEPRDERDALPHRRCARHADEQREREHEGHRERGGEAQRDTPAPTDREQHAARGEGDPPHRPRGRMQPRDAVAEALRGVDRQHALRRERERGDRAQRPTDTEQPAAAVAARVVGDRRAHRRRPRQQARQHEPEQIERGPARHATRAEHRDRMRGVRKPVERRAEAQQRADEAQQR